MTQRLRAADIRELRTAADMNGLSQEFNAVMDEIGRLRAALSDAADCIDSWGGYASPYFQQKHDLAGDIARVRAALGEEK